MALPFHRVKLKEFRVSHRPARALKPAALAAVAALAAGVSAPAVGAAPKVERAKSKVSLTYTGSSFAGRVGSPQARCERNREVTIIYTRLGDSSEFDRATTDSDGRYDTGITWADPGRYVAKVKRVKRGGLVCLGAQSRPYRMQQTL